MARFGSAVVVADASAEHSTFTNALLAVLEPAGGEANCPAPADLAWQLVELLGAHRATAPAFGVAVSTSAGYLVVLHGAVRALVRGADADVNLTGRGALTWVDHVVSGPFTSISVTLAEEGTVDADLRSDLRGGLVPGRGLVLTPANAPEAPVAIDEPIGPPTEPWAATDGPVDESELRANEEQVAAQPVGGEAEWPIVPGLEADPIGTSDPDVDPALITDLSTFPNRPASVHETVAAPAEPGALVADDGARTVLDRSYVFGREPQYDESVTRGEASPVQVHDPDNLISRVQAHVSVDPSGVTVRDASSSNGTFIAAPGTAEWVRLGEEPAALPVGWSMRMGRRVFTHLLGS
ncbi:MAG: FHA domain-containing protein [Jatrophihabitantaceae bacterium]